MGTSTGRILVAGSALLLTIVVVAPRAAGSPSSVRYASPHGSGSTCTKKAPCGLVTAVNDAGADSEIVINAGHYGSASHPLSATLEDNAADLDIHGEPGALMPVIYSQPSGDAVELTQGSVLSEVEIITSAGAYGVDDTASADHVLVIDTAQNGTACAVSGKLSDSLCIATGTDGTAIGLSVTAITSSSIDGDTAEAPGSGGTGLSAATAAAVPFSVFGDNDIVHGGHTDIAAVDGGGPVTVGLQFSDYSSTATTGVASVLSDPSNLDARPKFVGAAANDYREAAGSVTINAGSPDPSGDTDLAGLPRTLGPAPDMGAYEHGRPPAVHDFRVRERTAHTVQVVVTVNPHELGTTVELVATRKGHHHTSALHHVGHGTTPITVRLKLHKLKPRTTYHLHVVATNAVGPTATGPHTVKTR
jgi:hypothetical protein